MIMCILRVCACICVCVCVSRRCLPDWRSGRPAVCPRSLCIVPPVQRRLAVLCGTVTGSPCGSHRPVPLELQLLCSALHLCQSGHALLHSFSVVSDAQPSGRHQPGPRHMIDCSLKCATFFSIAHNGWFAQRQIDRNTCNCSTFLPRQCASPIAPIILLARIELAAYTRSANLRAKWAAAT